MPIMHSIPISLLHLFTVSHNKIIPHLNHRKMVYVLSYFQTVQIYGRYLDTFCMTFLKATRLYSYQWRTKYHILQKIPYSEERS